MGSPLWWWRVEMVVPVRVSMPRALYGRLKPWLIRRGVVVIRAGRPDAEESVMGTIALPIPWADFHRNGHPPAFAYGQPARCPICGKTRAEQEREARTDG